MNGISESVDLPSWNIEVGEGFMDKAGIDIWPEDHRIMVQGWARGFEDRVAHVLVSPNQARLMAEALNRFAAFVETKFPPA